MKGKTQHLVVTLKNVPPHFAIWDLTGDWVFVKIFLAGRGRTEETTVEIRSRTEGLKGERRKNDQCSKTRRGDYRV